MEKRKTALITGAQQGIGAAIAAAMIESDVNVVMNYLDDEQAVSRLVEVAKEKGVGAIAIQGDVANIEQVQMMVDAGDQFGGIDFLASNAAIYPRKSWWVKTLNLHLFSEHSLANQCLVEVMEIMLEHSTRDEVGHTASTIWQMWADLGK